MVTCQKITQDSSVPPAVAAATPHPTGTPTPRADAAGARGNLTREQLAERYTALVGYDPFAEGWTEEEVRASLAELEVLHSAPRTTFRFPVTLTGYVEIEGDIAEEAMNTAGIDLRNAIEDEGAKGVELDNGGKLTLEGFEIDHLPIVVSTADMRARAEAPAMLKVLRKAAQKMLMPADIGEILAILARIDGEA